IPTGIVVSSQQERSQHKNKGTAMKMLKNRLYQLEAEKQAKKKAELDATKSDVSFGNQIRSYVFQPYTMVNDHRTELKIPDVQRIMDGDIDPFIETYLTSLGGNGRGGAGGGPAARATKRASSAARGRRSSTRSCRGACSRSRTDSTARIRPPMPCTCIRRIRRAKATSCASRGGSWRGARTARRRSRISRMKAVASSSTS